MTFGLKTLDAHGETTLDTHSRLSRLLFWHETAVNEEDSIALEDAAMGDVFVMSYHIGGGTEMGNHVVTRSGNTFSWEPSAYAQTNNIDVSSLILIFLYT